jgi:hypothetical protein
MVGELEKIEIAIVGDVFCGDTFQKCMMDFSEDLKFWFPDQFGVSHLHGSSISPNDGFWS